VSCVPSIVNTAAGVPTTKILELIGSMNSRPS
jgi:hypothetical protein